MLVACVKRHKESLEYQFPLRPPRLDCCTWLVQLTNQLLHLTFHTLIGKWHDDSSEMASRPLRECSGKYIVLGEWPPLRKSHIAPGGVGGSISLLLIIQYCWHKGWFQGSTNYLSFSEWLHFKYIRKNRASTVNPCWF